MHSIHFHDVRMLKGPNLFALSVGVIVWFSIGIFFFLVSWAAGGTDFKDSIGGNVGLAGLICGLVIGAILCAVTRPEE